jgi:predicted Zn-dependent protease
MPIPNTYETSLAPQVKVISGLITLRVALSWIVVIVILHQGALSQTVADIPLQLFRLPENLAIVHVFPPVTETQSRASQEATNSKSARKYDISHIGSRGIGKGFNLYSLDLEGELGRELATEVDLNLGDPVDENVVEYINRLAQSLFVHSDSKFPIRARVYESADVNAFSLPGGYLYVSTGLIVAAESEAELAGVMAHEIAHIAARHGTKSQSRRMLFGFAALPFSFVGGGAGLAISAAVSHAMQPLSTAKFSRNAEREADLLGLQYTYASGYDPGELVHFFERYLKQEPETRGSLFNRLLADHPMTADRIERLQQQLETELPVRSEYVVDTKSFEEARDILLKPSCPGRENSGPTQRLNTGTAEPTE